MGIDLGPILYTLLAVEVAFGLLCLAGVYLLVRKGLGWTKAERGLPTVAEGENGSGSRPRFSNSWALVKR